MKTKNSGVSLIIAIGLSFIVVGLSLSTLASITKSIQRSSILERSNQIFYGAETGTEAAFFHHNARGQGVHFCPDGLFDPEGNCEMNTVNDESQKIVLPNTSVHVAWAINGRDVAERYGLLHEHQTIQVPFYWFSNSIDEFPADEGIFSSFSLAFIKPQNSDGTEINFSSFDFGKPNQNPDTNADAYEVLIDWSISRKTPTKGIQTFTPVPVDGEVDPCVGATNFLCENNFDDFVNGSKISNTSTLAGRVMPCPHENPEDPYDADANNGCHLNLQTFFSEGSNYKLTFRPLLKFEDSTDPTEKIPGIPYKITATGQQIPKSTYFVTAQVSIGDFSQEIKTGVRERVAIGAFDYVIFD